MGREENEMFRKLFQTTAAKLNTARRFLMNYGTTMVSWSITASTSILLGATRNKARGQQLLDTVTSVLRNVKDAFSS